MDNDAGSLRGLAMALKMLKHSCNAFCNPFDAWEEFKICEYDAVITDICMPGLNGIELGNQMIQLRPDACIIYMSGQLSENAEEELKKDGERIFLRKPIEFDEIREILNCGGCPNCVRDPSMFLKCSKSIDQQNRNE